MFFARVTSKENRLRGWNNRPAAKALQYAERHQRGQVPGGATQHTRGSEYQNRCDEIPAIAEATLEPARHRNDDDIGHHVTRRNPGYLINGCPETGANIVERNIDDGDVE